MIQNISLHLFRLIPQKIQKYIIILENNNKSLATSYNNKNGMILFSTFRETLTY